MTGAVIALPGAQAAQHARGTLPVDQSWFPVMGHGDRGDARKGITSRRGLGRPHVPVAPHGVAAAGRRHGPPVPWGMHRRVPPGAGRAVLDAAHPVGADRGAIARGGRDPVACPGRNPGPGGCHAMGEMPGRRRDDPGRFGRTCHRRSLAGTAFSVTREGSGAVARARTQPCGSCSSYSSASAATSSPRLFRRQGGPRLAYAAHKPPAAAQNPGFSRAGPHESIGVLPSPYVRTHQNGHKSWAENPKLDSARHGVRRRWAVRVLVACDAPASPARLRPQLLVLYPQLLNLDAMPLQGRIPLPDLRHGPSKLVPQHPGLRSLTLRLCVPNTI